MKKKITGLLLTSFLMTGVLAGCGGAKQTGASSDSQPASSASAGSTIKVGENLELSGAVASYGQSIAEGVDLAIDEINGKGGVDGKKFEVVKVDNKSDAAEATSAALKLTSQNKVNAIIGSATSGNTIAQIQVATDNKTVVISPSGTNPKITVGADGKVNEYMFRTCFIDPFQGTVAANFAAKKLNVKKAAVFADSSSDYAKGLASAFKDQFKKNGGQIVDEEAYVAKDTDFRATLTRIKAANPEFIFLPGYYEEVGLIVKQARELGITVPIMGGDGWDSPKLVQLAGKDALNNTYITNHYSSGDKDPKIQKFVSDFKAKYGGKTPDGFNALGYDSVYFLADAIKRAGGLDPVKVKDALAQTKDLSLVSGTFSLDKNHDPIKSATVLKYENGEQKFETKVNP